MDSQKNYGKISGYRIKVTVTPSAWEQEHKTNWSIKVSILNTKLLAAAFGACIAATAMAAEELMIFPNNDQTEADQEADKFACYSWAKGETDFDPMALPTATEAPPQQEAAQGGLARGAVRGAALGQIIGGDSDSTRSGAAAGAVIGGMRRSDQKHKEQQAQAQWEEEQQRIYAEARNRYNRAYAACLEGKDYTVR